jgi:hypothetical protein
MPVISVGFRVPYSLRITSTKFQTSPNGDTIQLYYREPVGESPNCFVNADFECDHVDDLAKRLEAKEDYARRLLMRTNRLLRWYRAVTQNAEILELTRAQASPFVFSLSDVGPSETWDTRMWNEPLEYADNPLLPREHTIEDIIDGIHRGLISYTDPKVEVLFLLDVERAIQGGRFREAVLLCWSTIDSVFNRVYDRFVDAKLAGEWSGASDALKGRDLGLRTKMTAGLKLIAGRSLFDEPNDFWTRLSRSYSQRNDSIHRGTNANEEDARAALGVARETVAVMKSIC